MRIALRVDVCSYVGLRDGVPGVLEELARAGVRATFFIAGGPDRSGTAIARAWRRPGFVGKLWRTNAVAMYGVETALAGTLLPAQPIAAGLPGMARAARAAGHEIGLHGWDHCRWQDDLEAMTPAEIAAELARADACYREVFGAAPRAAAAPAWLATPASLVAQEALGLAWASDVRSVDPAGAAAFHPVVAGRRLATLQVPVTLPTLDEELGRAGVTAANYVERLMARMRPDAWNVHAIHAEAEGRAFRPLLRRLLAAWRAAGAAIGPLGEVAAESRRAGAPERAVRLGEIPGRAGRVALVG